MSNPLFNQNEMLKQQILEQKETIKDLEETYKATKTQFLDLHLIYKEAIRENDLAKVLISHKWDELAKNDSKAIKNIEAKTKQVMKFMDELNFMLSEFYVLAQKKNDKENVTVLTQILKKSKDVQEIDKV